MNEERKRLLRARYVEAHMVVEAAMNDVNCGVAMLRYINSNVERACRAMESVEAEVRQAMAVGER